MDSKDTLRNLLISAAVFLLIMVVGTKFLSPSRSGSGVERPMPDTGTPRADIDSSSPGGAGKEPSGEAPSAGSPDRPAPTTTTTSFVVKEATQEQRLVMGTPDLDEPGDAEGNSQTTDERDWASEPYRMQLVLSNVGASIESATMTDHAEAAGEPARYKLLKLIERDDGTSYRSLAIEKVNVDDEDVPLHDRKWYASDVRDTEDGQTVDFWITIQKEGADALKITRTLTLPRQPRDSGRHDLTSDLTIENLSQEPHRVGVTYRGGLGIERANPRMDDRVVDFGILDSEGRVAGSRETQADVAKKHRFSLFKREAGGEPTRFSWGATGNIYFTCTIAPLGPNGQDAPVYINEVEGLDVDGDPLTSDDATLRFVTRTASIEPGGTLAYPAAVYLGEKDPRSFRSESDYSLRNYYYQIVKGFGWCTFNWLIELMLWLLNTLFGAVRDYGLAIVIMVLIVRTLLHPITKKGQVNMVRMQHRMGELAPKIEEIKKKYANDKARLNQEMMKLNINPAGQLVTCLPMLIQMPIWIALYMSLGNNIQMRHEPFHLTWITDLTAPDALYTFATPITVPLFGWQLPSFNLLPILVSIFMYTQQKLQPKPKPNPNATDQQRQQQEMMQKMAPMMSIMMLLIFYKMPSGLNLYIMSSSLFGTIEQWRIRKHIKEREESGTLHKPRDEGGKEPRSGAEAQRGWRKPKFLERIQKMAEDAQKGQGTTKAKRRR